MGIQKEKGGVRGADVSDAAKQQQEASLDVERAHIISQTRSVEVDAVEEGDGWRKQRGRRSRARGGKDLLSEKLGESKSGGTFLRTFRSRVTARSDVRKQRHSTHARVARRAAPPHLQGLVGKIRLPGCVERPRHRQSRYQVARDEIHDIPENSQALGD